MKIYMIECTNEDGRQENGGCFINIENAEKEKIVLENQLRNLKYGIKYYIQEVETND
jgi:hypothetical protein